MSGSNSHKAAREKMAKTKSKENKRKRQMKHRIAKRPRLRTDINQRVLTNPFRRLSTEKEMSISMVGLDEAGKTSILYKLGEDMVVKTSAEGLHLETLVYDNITLNAWDVSGAHKTRLQGIHFKDTKGLIFVVDSTARDKLDRASRELHMLLNEDLLKDVVLLVFANKQDVPKRMNEAEITEMLGLSSPIPQRHCRVQITCATSGEGLYEGLDWLSKKIKHTCATSRDGVSEGLNWLRNSSANKSNMRIFKVSESADSASIANKVRDVQEAYNRWLAQGEKVKLLEAAMREEKMKEDSCTRKLGVQVQRLIKKVKKYDRDENRKRASAERIARNYLKYRSKHTRD